MKYKYIHMYMSEKLQPIKEMWYIYLDLISSFYIIEMHSLKQGWATSPSQSASRLPSSFGVTVWIKKKVS